MKTNNSMAYGKLLFIAIEQADAEQIRKLLLNGADKTVLNEGQLTPIKFAARQKKWNCVAIFADFKADDKDNAHYGSALIDAIQAKEINLAHKLIDAGASFEWFNRDSKQGVLHYAVKAASMTLIETLLLKGASANGIKDCTQSPLEIALELNFVEAVRLLIQHGADFNEKLLQKAAKNKQWDCINAVIASMEPSTERIEQLLKLLGDNLVKKISMEATQKGFICPISKEFMKEPVKTAEGHTYNKSDIYTWLEKNNTCPLTRKNLLKHRLVEDKDKKEQIIKFLEEKFMQHRRVIAEKEQQELAIKQQELDEMKKQIAANLESNRETLAASERQKFLQDIRQGLEKHKPEFLQQEEEKLRLEIRNKLLQKVEQIENEERLKLLQETNLLNKFKEQYLKTYQAQFFRNPYSTMLLKINNDQLKSLAELKDYIDNYPNSRSAVVYRKLTNQ